MKEKIIVIGGGVGPMAGVELHKRVIENTLTDGTDQSHMEVLHLSRSGDVPDRTGFLLKSTTKSLSLLKVSLLPSPCAKAIPETAITKPKTIAMFRM